MKRKLIFLPILAASLASCGGSSNFVGKSYSVNEISTTFEGCEASDMFSSDLRFASQNEYELAIKNRLISTANDRKTPNEKFNISNVGVSNTTLYNGKETKVYTVNHVEVSEFEGDSLCQFGLDPEKSNVAHLYKVNLQSDGSAVLDLYKLLGGTRTSYSGGTLFEYEFKTYDNGIDIDGSSLTINLVSTIKVSIDAEENTYTCKTQVKLAA